MTVARVLLVTGGSRGIGAATARLAATRGYDVCIAYREDENAARAVCADIESLGRTALAVQADVSDESSVRALFDDCLAAFGHIDVLVNNAGMLETQGRFADMDVARWRRVFGVNTFGTMLCCQAAIRHMSTRVGGAGGVIVNVSSIAARLGSPGEYVDYAAAKGAVESLTLGLARELAGEGIRVNAVRPGTIDTDIHARGGEPGRVDRVARKVPLGRGGRAGEIAAGILWLASDEASYATATILELGGGL